MLCKRGWPYIEMLLKVEVVRFHRYGFRYRFSPCPHTHTSGLEYGKVFDFGVTLACVEPTTSPIYED